MTPIKKAILISSITLTYIPTAFCSSKLGNLPIATGIAAPSIAFSVFQNPAGLADSSNRISLFGGYTDCCPSSTNGTFGLNYKSDNYGVAGGVTYRRYQYEYLSYSSTSNLISARWGGAFKFSKYSLGLSGESTFSPYSSTSLTAGLRYKYSSSFILGLSVYNLMDEFRSFGAGGVYELNQNLSIATDVTTDMNFNAFFVNPGVRLESSDLGVSVSYGLRIYNYENNFSNYWDTLTAGAYWKFGSRWSISAFYQAVDKYNLVLSRTF